MAGLTGKFTVLPHGKLDSRATTKTNPFESAKNWVSLSGQAAQESRKEGCVIVTHLLKLIGRWAILRPAGEMEDVGVQEDFLHPFPDSLLGTQYFLPFWVIMKQIFSRGSCAHSRSVRDTIKWTTHDLVSS